MKRIMIAISMIAILCAGCSLIQFGGDAKSLGKQAPALTDAANDVTDVVEGAMGKPVLSKETAETGEDIAGKVGTGAEYVQKGADVITDFLPEDKKPYGELVGGLAYAVAALGAGAAEWFRRRKNKALKMAVMAAEKSAGGGAALVEAAAKAGVLTEVNAEYEKQLATGLAEKSKSAISAGT